MDIRDIYGAPSRVRVEVTEMRASYDGMIQFYAAFMSLLLLALALWRL